MKNNEPISILIIDDSLGDQVLLQENLACTGLNIEKLVFAGTMQEGLSAMRENDFSLLFLDLFLPDSEGLNSLSKLLGVNQKLPVIIYSGLADTHVALKAITLGAQDFLIKGDYNIGLLEKTVRYSIERKSNLDALQESNARYSLLSRATHDMVWDWDLRTNIVYRNKEGWLKIFRSKDDVDINVKDEFTARIHPDDLERVEQIMNEVIASNDLEVFEAEFRIVRDDGTIGCIQDRGHILRDKDGFASRIIGASHDITDRKDAEEKVKLSEERFRSLVQNSNDLLAILDTKGDYKYISPTSYKLLGFEPEYFIGKNAFSFIHEDDRQQTLDCLDGAGGATHIVAPPFRVQNAEGEWRWIESTITNMLEDPAVGGIVVNSRDVTDRKLAHDEIEKLSLVAKNTNSGVYILGKDQKIFWVNEAFTHITGYTLDEAAGKHPTELLYQRGTSPEVFAPIFEKINNGLSYVGERRNCTKSGRLIWVWLELQVIYDNEGKITQYFGVQTDITRQKELEEKVESEKTLKQKQITDAVYEAQENERTEIGRELHDNVNQLLGAIRLYVNMAKTDEEERESLLTDASDFALTAIEEIRKLSRTLITPHIQELGLIESIKQLTDGIMVVHPLRLRVIAENFVDEKYNNKFKLNIFRICQEQLNNVLKHAQADEAVITIKVLEGNILITIADNGVGFCKSERKNGVGLTNIKSRSELYNGKVDIISAVGEGTTLAVNFDQSVQILKAVNLQDQ